MTSIMALHDTTGATAPPNREERRKRLVQLGADALSEALLEMAANNHDVADAIDRLIASPEENIVRFREKLQSIREMDGYVDRHESHSFAWELESLLSDLKAGVTDPRTGVELVATFFELDRSIMESCDDSDGVIGDLFTLQARDLFWHFAAECEDKDWVFDLVVALLECDDYGVRSTLMEVPGDLSEATVRHFVERLWLLANNAAESPARRKYLRDIKTMARRLKDAALFEKCAWMLEKELSGKTMVEIAKAYLESGEAETALYWMERVPEDDLHRGACGFDELLFQIHKEMNNTTEMAAIAWRKFHAYRSEHSLEILISTIGEDLRKEVVDVEARLIRESKGFSHSDVEFLVHAGLLEDVEEYVLKRAGQLNGNFYTSLVSVAEALESDGRLLAASLIYRALLDSILERAQSRAYHHGADYLKKLESMAPRITRWEGHAPHGHYVNGLRVSHGRKYGFWGQFRSGKTPT